MLSYTKQKEFTTPNAKSRNHYSSNGGSIFKNTSVKDKNGQKKRSQYQIKKTQTESVSKCSDECTKAKGQQYNKKRIESGVTCKFQAKSHENRDFLQSSFAENCKKSTLQSFKYQEKVEESNKPQFQLEESQKLLTNKNQIKEITVQDMSHSSDSDSSDDDCCDGHFKVQSQIVFSKSSNLTGEAKMEYSASMINNSQEVFSAGGSVHREQDYQSTEVSSKYEESVISDSNSVSDLKGAKKDTTSRSTSLTSSETNCQSEVTQSFSNYKNSISHTKQYASIKELMQSMGEPLNFRKHLFTPSTPYVHKFRTEMCKNFELYKKCKYGDECSFAHGKQQIMMKSDVSALYKTKQCKKYLTNGFCPYGQRCQFIHDESEKASLEQSTSATQAQYDFIVPSQSEPVQVKQQSDTFFDLIQFQLLQQQNQKRLQKQNKSIKSQSHNIYSEILVHCINVSLQEHQKKLCMYHKKFSKRCDVKQKINMSEVRQLGQQCGILSPELQYMNIYKGKASRLKCFSSIAKDDCVIDEEETRSLDYHHGDASSYELYLDQMCKKMPQAKRAIKAAQLAEQQIPHEEYCEEYQCQDIYDNGYGYGYNNCGGQDVVSSIFYELNAKKMREEQQRLYLLQQRQLLAESIKAPLNIHSQAFRPTFVPVIKASE